MNATEELEKQADKLFDNVAGWETSTLCRIAKRIKQYGRMSVDDVKKINNIAVVKQDMKGITKELAKMTGYNISQIDKIYGNLINSQNEELRYLYDYRNKPFESVAENKRLQALVNSSATNTANEFLNLAKTKALGLIDQNGNFLNLEKAYKSILDKAVVSNVSASTDFYTEMRSVVKQMGGSGVRIDYGNGVTRGIDGAVRQSLLWGAKQTSVKYNEMIGEELGCDGIEVDWHYNPRPSHAFMNGKQFVLGKARTIRSVYYPSADEALARLQDYGCLHFKMPIVCGVSEPAYDKEELKRLNAENNKKIKIGEDEKTGYEWQQDMRAIERAVRNSKQHIEVYKAGGFDDLAKEERRKIRILNERYSKIAEITGIPEEPARKRITAGAKSLKDVEKTILQSPQKTKTPKVEIPKKDLLSFTKDEENALEWYVSGEGMWINQYLRNPAGFGSLSKEEKQLLDEITSATERPLAENIKTLYRSVDAKAIFGDLTQSQYQDIYDSIVYKDTFAGKKVNNIINNAKGKEITDKGFVSTSKKYEDIEEWGDFTGSSMPINIKFEVPKGIQGADLQKWEVEGEEQHEVLLTRNTKYKIKDIKNRNGYIFIEAELIK